jgi:hypothetical protein
MNDAAGPGPSGGSSGERGTHPDLAGLAGIATERLAVDSPRSTVVEGPVVLASDREDVTAAVRFRGAFLVSGLPEPWLTHWWASALLHRSGDRWEVVHQQFTAFAPSVGARHRRTSGQTWPLRSHLLVMGGAGSETLLPGGTVGFRHLQAAVEVVTVECGGRRHRVAPHGHLVVLWRSPPSPPDGARLDAPTALDRAGRPLPVAGMF